MLLDDRKVWVRAYPVSIDPDALHGAAQASRVRKAEQELLARRRRYLLLRVDRLDPSKNVMRGFEAFAASWRCTPSSRTRSPSSPCCSLRARTWRSTPSCANA